ncbi:MAG: hypothetical protein LQ340_006304, partial [Diploschistes diacapsis]
LLISDSFSSPPRSMPIRASIPIGSERTHLEIEDEVVKEAQTGNPLAPEWFVEKIFGKVCSSG